MDTQTTHQIDYRLILFKYIFAVLENESVTYVPDVTGSEDEKGTTFEFSKTN